MDVLLMRPQSRRDPRALCANHRLTLCVDPVSAGADAPEIEPPVRPPDQPDPMRDPPAPAPFVPDIDPPPGPDIRPEIDPPKTPRQTPPAQARRSGRGPRARRAPWSDAPAPRNFHH